MAQEESYISLKEAAELSGYSPDYIGQLIRAGKLSGKQIYSNVQWVTTEKEVKSYLDNKSGSNAKKDQRFDIGFLQNRALDDRSLLSAYRLFLYGLIGIGVMFLLFLFYVLAVNIDRKIQARALITAEEIEILPIPIPLNEEGDPVKPL